MFITKKKLKELIERERREWERKKSYDDDNSRIWHHLYKLGGQLEVHDNILRDLTSKKIKKENK